MTEKTPETQTQPEPSTQKKPIPARLLIGVFVVSLLISGVLIFALLNILLDDNDNSEFDNFLTSAAGGASLIDPPRDVIDFSLPAHTGESLAIGDLQGRAVLMFFGYTNCPDVCPLTMLDYRDVYEQLGDQAEDVAFVYISVDGERDTPAVMADYIARRNMSDYVIGMSGDVVTLNQIMPDYSLRYTLNDADENGYYTVDHSANMYLLNPDGQLTTIFSYGTEPELITSTIQDVLNAS